MSVSACCESVYVSCDSVYVSCDSVYVSCDSAYVSIVISILLLVVSQYLPDAMCLFCDTVDQVSSVKELFNGVTESKTNRRETVDVSIGTGEDCLSVKDSLANLNLSSDHCKRI